MRNAPLCIIVLVSIVGCQKSAETPPPAAEKAVATAPVVEKSVPHEVEKSVRPPLPNAEETARAAQQQAEKAAKEKAAKEKAEREAEEAARAAKISAAVAEYMEERDRRYKLEIEEMEGAPVWHDRLVSLRSKGPRRLVFGDSEDDLYLKHSRYWLGLKVGRVGYVGKMIVSQIRDRQTMLLDSGRWIVRARGWDTTGMVDGQWFKPGSGCIVSGTETYGNVQGGTNTVFVIEPFDLAAHEAKHDAEKAEQEAKIRAAELLAGESALAEAAKREGERKVKADAEVKENKRKWEAAELAEKRDLEKNRTRDAKSKLRLAKKFLDANDLSVAKNRLNEIIKQYPDTDEAKEARTLLQKLDQDAQERPDAE